MASFDGLAFSDTLRNRFASSPGEAWRKSEHKTSTATSLQAGSRSGQHSAGAGYQYLADRQRCSSGQGAMAAS
jgi:hypothetical protein